MGGTFLLIQPKQILVHFDLNTINNKLPSAPDITTTKFPISDKGYTIYIIKYIKLGIPKKVGAPVVSSISVSPSLLPCFVCYSFCSC